MFTHSLAHDLRNVRVFSANRNICSKKNMDANLLSIHPAGEKSISKLARAFNQNESGGFCVGFAYEVLKHPRQREGLRVLGR